MGHSLADKPCRRGAYGWQSVNRTRYRRVDAGYLSASFRRRPEPITTGVSGQAKAVEQRLSTRGPRRMGPGLRRGDVEVGCASDSNFKQPNAMTLSRGKKWRDGQI